MASSSRYEVEVTVSSARDLKNVNWRHGDLKPYAVVWVDPASKCSTKVDVEGDVNPVWDEKLRIPLPYDRRIEDSTLCIDVVHARSDDQDGIKPLIGSARLPLREVVDEAGIGGAKVTRSLKLKRPSGRPHGRIEVRVAVKEPSRYYDPYGQPTGSSLSRDYPTPPPAYGRPQYGGGYAQPTGSSSSRDYPAYGQPQYGSGYAQSYSAAPPAGYPYSAPPPAYGAPTPVYGGAPSAYGQPAASYGGDQGYGAPPAAAAVQGQKKSKFGMGTGLAVGAVGGLLGGLALAEGIDYAEDKIEDHVAEKVEDDLPYDDRVDDGLAYEDGGYDDF